jgi:hypothetical protein
MFARVAEPTGRVLLNTNLKRVRAFTTDSAASLG